MFVNIFLGVGLFLVFLLALLLFLFFRNGKKEKVILSDSSKTINFQGIVKSIQVDVHTTADLEEKLALVLKDYGDIEDFTLYEELLISITTHPKIKKNIILNFDKELSKRNPRYKKRISDTIVKALNLR